MVVEETGGPDDVVAVVVPLVRVGLELGGRVVSPLETAVWLELGGLELGALVAGGVTAVPGEDVSSDPVGTEPPAPDEPGPALATEGEGMDTEVLASGGGVTGEALEVEQPTANAEQHSNAAPAAQPRAPRRPATALPPHRSESRTR